jgi:hypothetical protein
LQEQKPHPPVGFEEGDKPMKFTHKALAACLGILTLAACSDMHRNHYYDHEYYSGAYDPNCINCDVGSGYYYSEDRYGNY